MHISVTEGHFHISRIFMTLNFDLHKKNFLDSVLCSVERGICYITKTQMIMHSSITDRHASHLSLFSMTLNFDLHIKKLLALQFCAAELGLNHITKISVNYAYFCHRWAFP